MKTLRQSFNEFLCNSRLFFPVLLRCRGLLLCYPPTAAKLSWLSLLLYYMFALHRWWNHPIGWLLLFHKYTPAKFMYTCTVEYITLHIQYFVLIRPRDFKSCPAAVMQKQSFNFCFRCFRSTDEPKPYQPCPVAVEGPQTQKRPFATLQLHRHVNSHNSSAKYNLHVPIEYPQKCPDDLLQIKLKTEYRTNHIQSSILSFQNPK